MLVKWEQVKEDLARKDAEIERLTECLKRTLETLKTANTEGLISDTIWYSDIETLFDFIEERVKP